jgi:hypothetical protein
MASDVSNGRKRYIKTAGLRRVDACECAWKKNI